MLERIILAPGASPTELLRTLARFGISTIGLRVCDSAELARIALMKSGICVSGAFLPSQEESSLIFSFLKDVPYFASASYADAQALTSALSAARKLISLDESTQFEAALRKGEFLDKNEALIKVYEKYMTGCREKGRIDGISLVRRALAESLPFSAEFLCLKEFPLTNLDRALLKHVSSGNCRETNLPELFGKECKTVSVHRVTAAYGAINEAEDILRIILEEKLPLDSCTVACTSPDRYGQIFYDLSKRYGIPITFGSGIPIRNAYPAVVLARLLEWNTSGFNGVDSLHRLIYSEAFDRSKLMGILAIEGEPKDKHKMLDEVIGRAGNLRIGFHKAENDRRIDALLQTAAGDNGIAAFDQVCRLAAELELGYAYLVETYSVIRHDAEKLDESAVSVICSALKAYEAFSGTGSIEEIIPDLLHKTVGSEISREGFLHVCSIPAAMSVLRQNLFVCGLSAAEFPGSPRENFLLLDSDLQCFGEAQAPTSELRIRLKKQGLLDLLTEASSLSVSIRLSYADFDLAALKEQNPSSVLFELYETAYPGTKMEDFKTSIVHRGYFEAGLSASDRLGAAYAAGKTFDAAPDKQETPVSGALLDRYWSPSALDMYFQCPRRFYLQYAAGIWPEEPDDPFVVIDPADEGTLVHGLMEELPGTADKETFLTRCGEAFDQMLLARPPVHKDAAARKRAEFLKMMKNVAEGDPHRTVLSAEKEYRHIHPSGVRLHGYPDRIEQLPDGKALIVDFKTKRKVEHVKNDIDTCLQAVVYAWLGSQEGLKISDCEYRYLRKDKTIHCVYDESMQQALDSKLRVFRQALETGDFPRDPGSGKKNCKYCRLGDICLWPGDERKEESGDE